MYRAFVRAIARHTIVHVVEYTLKLQQSLINLWLKEMTAF